MSAVLSIDDIVKIIINLSPRSAIRSGFNLSLIIGTSKAIPLETRVQVYSGAESMLDAGFSKDSLEYQIAQTYFAQTTRPGKLAIGRWDPENEKLVDAVAACRKANWDWYLCLPLSILVEVTKEPDDIEEATDIEEPEGTEESEAAEVVVGVYAAGAAVATELKNLLTSADILEVAKYVEGVRPSTVMFYTTKDIKLLAEMKAMNYRRSLGVYSETENLAVAVAGWAMGANTGLRNSAYTLAFKTLVGVKVDPLDENTVEALKKLNANYYVNRGMQYDVFEQGTMADGVWFDEIINLDMLENNIQLDIMDLLRSTKKVPQTEGGVLMIISAFTPALEKAVRTGFVAPGIWKAPGIMNLETGDAIPLGYLIQSEPVDEQSQADRDARLAPPIYVAIKLAGAIHYVVIQVDVNR